jgi:hypothetical protein
LGFENYPWHTHADLLAATFGTSAAEAVRKFVDELLSDKAVVVISKINGEIADIWISDDPEGELRYCGDDEELVLRYWRGREFTSAD